MLVFRATSQKRLENGWSESEKKMEMEGEDWEREKDIVNGQGVDRRTGTR